MIYFSNKTTTKKQRQVERAQCRTSKHSEISSEKKRGRAMDSKIKMTSPRPFITYIFLDKNKYITRKIYRKYQEGNLSQVQEQDQCVSSQPYDQKTETLYNGTDELLQIIQERTVCDYLLDSLNFSDQAFKRQLHHLRHYHHLHRCRRRGRRRHPWNHYKNHRFHPAFFPPPTPSSPPGSCS